MRTPSVVIGAGHAGLAVSRVLAERSLDHVVLERGEVANTWKTERWDSLRLLTPNWQTNLPGLRYDGDDPDGFMSMPDVIGFIEDYAARTSAPVRTGTTVESLSRIDHGYRLITDQGVWDAETVVIASGGFNLPNVPALEEDIPDSVGSLTMHEYKRAEDLPDGGVLVVGAAASGVQVADEILDTGRPVTIAVGEHVRMPRTYRGKDIQWWLDRTGLLDESLDDVDDIVRARHVSSPQLIGTPERRNIDLNTLMAKGARPVGKLVSVREGIASFSGSLRNVCKLADLKQARLLDTIDDWVAETGIGSEMPEGERFEPTRLEEAPLSIDLAGEGIETVIWATGYRPDYSWLDIPALDRKGQLRHNGGLVVDHPGLYRIGLNFLRRRKSSFIHGAEDDARDIVDHLAEQLSRRARSRAVVS